MVFSREGINAAQEISITGKSTSPENNQQAQPADSEGTLRAELLGKVLAAQADLETQLADLRRASGDAGLVMECSTQLSALIAMQQSISVAAPGALHALRAKVATSVAAASTAAQQARSAASGSAAAESAQLVAASAATRSEVQAVAKDLFEKRIFDKYLTFDPPEEEDAYRRREAERRHYIEQQQAHNTAEGNLNAASATVGQILDAGAHGAINSPEFMAHWERAVAARDKLRAAMQREGRSTEEADRRVTEDVRRFLKSQGVPEAGIEALLAASPDPLEAVKPYLKTQQAAAALDASIGLAQSPRTRIEVRTVTTTDTTPAPVPLSVGLDDVMSQFRAAGVASAEHRAEDSPAHGVAVQERPVPSKSRTPAG